MADIIILNLKNMSKTFLKKFSKVSLFDTFDCYDVFDRQKIFLETYQILSSFTVMIAVEKKKCSKLKVWMSNMI